jgi:hypothetical protein
MAGLSGTGVAVSGSSDETELAANGFEIVGPASTGLVVDGGGVWALAGSTVEAVLKFEELVKGEELLKREDVPTNDGVSKDSNSKGVLVT